MELKMRNTTLCYIENEDNYLMLHRVKKEDDQNKDKWIGVGGKFEDGETPEDCVCREVLEETGLTLTDYKYRGIVTFVLKGWGTEYMHLFTATGFMGEIKPCEEGDLEWVPKSEIENLNIWEGDKEFFRLLAEDVGFFSLKLVYENDKLIETDVYKY